MSAKMQGKQPIHGRPRSRTHAPDPVRSGLPTQDRPSPLHKRDLPSLQAYQDNLYLDAIWGDQMRQLCTEYDNQVHIARVPSAYQAMLAPPNPPLPELSRSKHVRFKSMPAISLPGPGLQVSLKDRAQQMWRQWTGLGEDTYGLLPK